ncbi:hypothetical protein IscW_ISCW007868 [Ixodes scapularis]|uniref:Uncharacterized protein n=1 Tax=Ixodes scapularis TaxID=6945 RepID=B7PVC3_IXOSC|nr:hypothetical protein IscW_ISCW007868 [Ixodes scapularis]|eukprot:XP_002407727.1 hypothetical protein IscW_ISCW007868 [Ixodes scapularis]
MVGAELLRPLPDVEIQERQAQVSIQSARLTPGGHILEIRGRDAHTQHSTGAGRLSDERRPHAGTRSAGTAAAAASNRLRVAHGTRRLREAAAKAASSGTADPLRRCLRPSCRVRRRAQGFPRDNLRLRVPSRPVRPCRERRHLGTPAACQDVTDATTLEAAQLVAQDSSDVL